LNEGQRTDLRFNTFGFILQASNLIPFLTVKDQLALVDRFNHHHKHETTMSALFDMLGISDLVTSYPAALSGGERQTRCHRASIVQRSVDHPRRRADCQSRH
jgi:putative ABC transport system ATP-binding protein